MKKHEKDSMLVHAIEIARGYDGNLTLRQLYYRLVAAGLLPSAQEAYKGLGDLIGEARLNGNFPLSWLKDRTREARAGDVSMKLGTPEWALDGAKEELAELPFRYLRQARWLGQDEYVLVAVEKEALAGVFEDPCDRLGVPWLVCRGYPSISTVHEMVCNYRQATFRRGRPYKSWVIVYFGDHDPDGLQIPVSLASLAGQVLERLAEDEADLRAGGTTVALQEADGFTYRQARREAADRTWMEHLPGPVVERVALTVEQIHRYRPPSFPAKESSPRFKSYVERTGLDEAWELDALEPRTLVGLIHQHVLEHFDGDVWRAGAAGVVQAREDLCRLLRSTPWVEQALEDLNLRRDLQAIDEVTP